MSINTSPDKHELVICANILVKNNGRYLMIRRSPLKKYYPDYLHAIGGKVDLNEEPLVAAKRELMEEAGVEVINLKLEAVVSEVILEKDEVYDSNWQVFYFSGDYEAGELKTTEEGELLWLTPEQIKKDKLSDSFREISEYIFDPNKGAVFAKFSYDKDDVMTEKIINVCVS